ncbi:MAG: metalloregulator ArsR/SmtB family transcription factor [Phycisphaerales bacterium]|nr:metalloregulator ArsR/SmtB family transcription factor [Phycisphaerales bacterium]
MVQPSPRPAKDLARALDADLFKALGDPTRLQLLACLACCCGPATVSQIAGCTSVDLSVVSRHLRTLLDAGVLTSAKQGKNVLYAVAYAPLAQALARVSQAVCNCDPANRSGGCNRACLCCKPGRRAGKGACC